MNGILGLFRNPKLALLAIFGAIGLWMLITPMYIYIINVPALMIIPFWVWMLVGLLILIIVAKYGKMML